MGEEVSRGREKTLVKKKTFLATHSRNTLLKIIQLICTENLKYELGPPVMGR